MLKKILVVLVLLIMVVLGFIGYNNYNKSVKADKFYSEYKSVRTEYDANYYDIVNSIKNKEKSNVVISYIEKGENLSQQTITLLEDNPNFMSDEDKVLTNMKRANEGFHLMKKGLQQGDSDVINQGFLLTQE